MEGRRGSDGAGKVGVTGERFWSGSLWNVATVCSTAAGVELWADICSGTRFR